MSKSLLPRLPCLPSSPSSSPSRGNSPRRRYSSSSSTPSVTSRPSTRPPCSAPASTPCSLRATKPRPPWPCDAAPSSTPALGSYRWPGIVGRAAKPWCRVNPCWSRWFPPVASRKAPPIPIHPCRECRSDHDRYRARDRLDFGELHLASHVIITRG